MYFQEVDLHDDNILEKENSFVSGRKKPFLPFFCFVTVESLPDLEKTCLRDSFTAPFSKSRSFCCCLESTSLTSETDIGGQTLSCGSSLLISWGGPTGSLASSEDSLASAAVQVGLCLSPPSLNEQTLPFIRDTSNSTLPEPSWGMAFYHFHFLQQGDTSASCGANYSELQCSVRLYGSPFCVSESSPCSIDSGIHTMSHHLF